MLNIANYWRNAKQNHNEVLLHTDYSRCNKKSAKNKHWKKCGGIGFHVYY